MSKKVTFTFEIDDNNTMHIESTGSEISNFELLAFLEITKQQCLNDILNNEQP